MVEKAYNTSSNTAFFACANCNRQHIVDVTKYLTIPKEIKLKVKCKCGHEWTATLEKRRHFRKEVKFSGKFSCRATGRANYEAKMQVVDLSRKGLKVKLFEKPGFVKVGDWVEVEFKLDNRPRTLIKRMAQVKNVDGYFLGLAFPDHKHEDPDIGFYMLDATNTAAAS
jgi:hypothetical protein